MLINAWHYFVAHWMLISGISAAVIIPTLISEFGDPDNDPKTPPPTIIRLLIVVQRILTLRAPKDALGIGNTRWSLPLLHYPRKRKGLALPTPPLPPPPAAASLLPLLFISLFGLAGCATAGQWRAAGIDVAKCVGSSVLNGAADALVDILNQANAGPAGADFYKDLGTRIASSYGVNAAVCAVGKLWSNLGGDSATASHEAPSKAKLAVDYLVKHQSEWAKK